MSATTAINVAQLVGAVSTATGAVVQAKALRTAGDLERRRADASAAEARQNAEDVLATGEIAEQRARRRTAKVLSAQRAAFGAQGVELSGSALDVQEETALIGALDAMTIRVNALRGAFGFQAEALAFEFTGRIAQIARRGQARATLASGGIQLARDLSGIAQGFEGAPAPEIPSLTSGGQQAVLGAASLGLGGLFGGTAPKSSFRFAGPRR